MVTDGLTAEAARLLTALRANEGPQTDRHLAGQAGLSVRQIVDVADELLQAGYLVVATTSPPFGRWLGTIADARTYERVLRSRALKILIRRRHLRQAIARQAGQLDMFTAAPLRCPACWRLHDGGARCPHCDRRTQAIPAEATS